MAVVLRPGSTYVLSGTSGTVLHTVLPHNWLVLTGWTAASLALIAWSNIRFFIGEHDLKTTHARGTRVTDSEIGARILRQPPPVIHSPED